MSTKVSGTVGEGVLAVSVLNTQSGASVWAAVAADGTFEANIPLIEGANDIEVNAWDAAGNQGTFPQSPATFRVVRDTIAPTISAELLVAGLAAPTVIRDVGVTQVTVSGDVPGTDVFFVTVNGQSVGDGGPFTRAFDLAVGDNVFVVQAVDDAGNLATYTLAVAYAPVVIQERANYNSIIASGVAVVLLIVGFVVGYLLSGRGGGGESPPPETAEMPPRQESRAEEELPRTEAPPAEEEEL
jgi:hypothetical protein